MPVTGTGTAANPFVAKGVKLTVAGAANPGDRFLIEPGRNAAAHVSVAISDPGKLAAAAPIRAAAALGNTGNGTISAGEVVNVADPNLRAPAAIQFTGPGTYSINGAGSYSYAAGSAITVNGWRVQIGGAPKAGDRFDVTPTPPNSGDDRNARLLGGIASKALLDGGLNTIGSAHGQLVEQVGGQAQAAGFQLDAQTALQAQTASERGAVSGVNLDEEAADLLRYQQAYQAAAQVVATAGNIFDALLAATRH